MSGGQAAPRPPTAEPPPTGRAARLGATWHATVRAYPPHRRVFVVGLALLNLVNLAVGGPWWAFWPSFAWAVAFAVHYLVHVGATVDDAWVDERTEELRQKSYDFSHIDSIKARHEGRPDLADRPARPARPAARGGAGARRPRGD